jgi:hypothetical protein
MKITRLPRVYAVTLPGTEDRCTYYVNSIRRERNGNNGHMLTMANAEYRLTGRDKLHRVCDIVTQMRLADLLSDLHDLKINADRLYGPPGRNCKVGRQQ